MAERLQALGFAAFEESFSSLGDPTLRPARVASVHAQGCHVLTENERELVPIPASLFAAGTRLAVGDWIALDPRGAIHSVLPRKTELARKAAGKSSKAQVIAANVDVVLIVSGGGQELNPHRIERYLALVWESGAEPILVLNKRDLFDDMDDALQALGPSVAGVSVFGTTALTGEGVEELLLSIPERSTIAMVGSSGVGKSSLLNAVAGELLEKTQTVRKDDERGRHTTTSRSLWPIRDWVWIDTPGLRELGMIEAPDGLAEVFDDVVRLAQGCRFRDCSHTDEPGCAVRSAVDDGTLAPDRLEHYLRLQYEQRQSAFRSDQQAQRQAGRRFGKMTREAQAWRKMRRGGD